MKTRVEGLCLLYYAAAAAAAAAAASNICKRELFSQKNLEVKLEMKMKSLMVGVSSRIYNSLI